MAEVITGLELKVRGFEAQDSATIGSDHKFNVDGPASGPRSVVPRVVAEGTLASLNRQSLPLNAATPRLPILFGPTASQAILAPLSEVLSGSGSLYLGAFTFAPTTDNQGQPIRVGSTYYNLQSQEMFVFSSAGVWVQQNQPSPGVLKAYYYFPGGDTTVIPDGGIGQPDAQGKFLAFDISGASGTDPVNVFVNGALLVNNVDYILHEGSASGGDYITFSPHICGGSSVVVQVNGKADVDFVVSSVAIATNTWALDGVAKTFPLVDQGGHPVFPQTAINCLVVINGRVLHPNVDYTINGSNITFTAAPFPGDDVWMTVGVPIQGAETILTRVISPFAYGGVGNGVADDTNAVRLAIQETNLSGGVLNLSHGTWRITSPLPVLTNPMIDGGGSGSLYLDFNLAGAPLIDCVVNVVATFAVSSITITTFDFAGTFSDDTPVTAVAVTVPVGQTPPAVGDIVKVTAPVQVVGSDAGDFIGQHLYAAAVVNTSGTTWTIYTPALLVDAYGTTDVQLHILNKRKPCILSNFSVRGNYPRLVAEDWRGIAVRIVAAVSPYTIGLTFEDLHQGLFLVGTWRASTNSTFCRRLRNATASEVPAVVGYGVVDAGSYMSVHSDLSGDDCRHIYTTAALQNTENPRVNWGRTFRPAVNSGAAGACSSAAYDTHSDCYEAHFSNLDVDGGYYGEQSTGSGFQFRGIRCKATNCHVRNAPQGFVFYKQNAGELTGHTLDNCSYIGNGKALRLDRTDTLSAVDAFQGGRVRNCEFGVFGANSRDAISIRNGTLEIEGVVKVTTFGNLAGARAVQIVENGFVNSVGPGRLVYDFSTMTGTPNPRLIVFTGANCGATLNAEVISGSVAWMGWVNENDTVPPTGAWFIDALCDKAPGNPSGAFSQNGANNRLVAGSLRLRSVVNRGRQGVAKSANFALFNSDHGQVITCTAAITITVPVPDVIGPDFQCTVVSTSGNVILDGPGASNVTVAAGSRAEIKVANGRVYSTVLAQTDMS